MSAANYSSLSDEELLKKYADDQLPAFDEFYHRHSSRVFSYAFQKLQNRQLANEVTQIIFLKLHQLREKYDSKYKAMQWLFVITNSEIRDMQRRENKHKNTSQIEKFENILSQNSEPVPSNLQGAAVAAVAKLDTVTQQILIENSVDGATYKEIAQRMGLSESNVRQIASRALRTLRKKLVNEK